MYPQELRLKVSGGLLVAALVIACVHAGTMATVIEMRNQLPTEQYYQPTIMDLPPILRTSAPSIVDTQSVQQEDSPPVNLTTQNEIKGQCLTCPPLPQQPSRIVMPQRPVIVPNTSGVPTRAPTLPLPRSPATVGVQPKQKQYQMLVFVSTDAQSQKIVQWFQRDPLFQKMRSPDSLIAVQFYAPGDALYQQRYAAVVPVSQFPAIILTDNQGGHVHAAAKQFIPPTAAELYADFRLGAQLYLEAKQQRPAESIHSGALKTRGYNWDNMVNDYRLKLQDVPEDCPDGYCPDDQSGNWTPGQKIRDLFADQANNTAQAVVWANAREILVMGAIVVGGLAVVILTVRKFT